MAALERVDAGLGHRPAAGLLYGGLGLPLAFVALPLYVNLPAHYAQNFGLPLAWLGGLLLAARLLDALVDPWLGRLCDRWLNEHPDRVLPLMGAAALALGAGFYALFFPPLREPRALLAWCGGFLLLCYGGYSLLSVMHQTWGARLGGSPAQQTRVVAWREGLALAGVITASLLPGWIGLGGTAAVLAAALALALLLLRIAPRALAGGLAQRTHAIQVWAYRDFRRLLAVFLLNGVAAAIPATLLLFFVRDRLQTPQAEGLYLASYFLAAALAMPLWLRLVARWGQARCWGLGMVLAVAAFAWTAVLGPGDQAGFVLVCLASGTALAADLAIPGAMLAGVIQRAGLHARAEGSFFGWWNAANKLNLALAAGLALPLLQVLGYTPGTRDAQALQALNLSYCLLPCALKLMAAALLYRHWIRPQGEDLP